jgi:mono/diheme cytochrome c family protein
MRRQYLSAASVAALLIVAGMGLAGNAAFAGAGPPPPPPPAKEPELVDPNDPDPPPAASATTKSAMPSTPADPVVVEKGRGMYRDYCQKCHGLNMVSPGGGFFDLRTFPHDDKARFVNSVTNGKRAMPAWGPILKPADIDTVWAYISSYKAGS